MEINFAEKLTVNTEELMQLCSCGRRTAIIIGTEANAEIRLGRKLLWHVGKIRDYLANVSGQKAE